MRNQNTYDSAIAKAVLQRILARLATGPADTIELIAVSGKSTGRARAYLMHMRMVGQIYCLAEAVFAIGGSKPAVWALNPAFVDAPLVDDSVDQFPRRVIVRQQWEPNHVRMTIDCLLFGVPKVLQGAAAC